MEKIWMANPAEIVNDLIKKGEFRLRVTLANLFNAQRRSLPMALIKQNGGAPANAISDWQNQFADWYLARRQFWQNLFNNSVRQIQEQKQTSQQFFDDLIEQRAGFIGLELAAVNSAVIGETLQLHAIGSVKNLDKSLRLSIGLRPDQMSAFAKQSALIVKNFPDKAKQQVMIDRLYNKKLNFRAQLIARTEISTAVNGAQLADIQSRIEKGELPNNMEKLWSTLKDDKVSELCAINEDEGWISLEEVFPSGHDAPPRFPGCRCGLQYRPRKEAA